MPQLIRHIDQIARQENRDVLFLVFDDNPVKMLNGEARENAMAWLEDNEIYYEPCGPVASDHGLESYDGHLYVEVPHQPSHPHFKQLLAHFENEDGSSKVPDTLIYCLSLSHALKNKHHDEPGYWDRIAEEL